MRVWPLAPEVPWDRYGLIVALVRELQGKSPQVGRTVLQKTMYLLQELGNVPCGYRFQLYTYGPFAAELLQDIDLVESLGGVRVSEVATGLGGYVIEPGERAEELETKAGGLLEDERGREAIASIAAEFGGYSAKELELRSTIVYVVRDLERQGKPVDWKRVHDLVAQLKPRFVKGEIDTAMAEMARHLSIREAA